MADVLVVDDSAVDRTLVGGLLEQDPQLRVTFAVHGADALQQMRARTPDLVVTDLVMPEMDGLQLVGEARRAFPLVPVILMTSRGSEEIAVRALHEGAASYVPKRILASDLVETVRKVLAVSRHQRGQRRLMRRLTQSRLSFELENDGSLFHPLVAYLQECATDMALCEESERTRIGIALEEALSNALYHGNLEVDSRLREEGDAAFYQAVEQRRGLPPYARRRIYVDASFSRREAVFAVRDEGPGFDPAALPDPTDPENLDKASGRGILLMRTFMDEVHYDETGSAVRMVKRCGGDRSGEAAPGNPAPGDA
jgi:CheY-like chemotaxis protein/anti-sigma regulatory factor (Ser/Thr protein kinase)